MQKLLSKRRAIKRRIKKYGDPLSLEIMRLKMVELEIREFIDSIR